MSYMSKEELILNLKQDGIVIGEQAAEGDLLALEIMKRYKFWYDCPGDNMAFVLCERSYSNWKRRKNNG